MVGQGIRELASTCSKQSTVSVTDPTANGATSPATPPVSTDPTSSETPPVSIDTHDAWVEFPIFDAKTRSLKKTFLGRAGGTIGRTTANVPVIEALRGITMSLQTGDRVGLVGHNGAGKSTLLRLLSGIYEPTRGSATVRGKVAPI
ncbi:MAG: ABC transporter ATP-binding protein, partial [Mycobacteriaceae bacterium]|nr:ABC transporter ATP-binding protein [Mycobacteriaceae bacterium]